MFIKNYMLKKWNKTMFEILCVCRPFEVNRGWREGAGSWSLPLGLEIRECTEVLFNTHLFGLRQLKGITWSKIKEYWFH